MLIMFESYIGINIHLNEKNNIYLNQHYINVTYNQLHGNVVVSCSIVSKGQGAHQKGRKQGNDSE